MTDFPTICILFCLTAAPSPTVVDSFARECRIIRPSRADSAETLRQVARENARCRAARTGTEAKR